MHAHQTCWNSSEAIQREASRGFAGSRGAFQQLTHSLTTQRAKGPLRGHCLINRPGWSLGFSSDRVRTSWFCARKASGKGQEAMSISSRLIYFCQHFWYFLFDAGLSCFASCPTNFNFNLKRVICRPLQQSSFTFPESAKH